MLAFWVVTPYGLKGRYQSFSETLLFLLRWGATMSLWNWASNGPIDRPLHDIGVNMEWRWNDIDRGDRRSRRKRVAMPLCPPEIPHELTWVWTWVSAARSQQLTAWTMVRLSEKHSLHLRAEDGDSITHKKDLICKKRVKARNNLSQWIKINAWIKTCT
jgi:hypothetical protein